MDEIVIKVSLGSSPRHPTPIAYTSLKGQDHWTRWKVFRTNDPITAIKFEDGSILDLIIGHWR